MRACGFIVFSSNGTILVSGQPRCIEGNTWGCEVGEGHEMGSQKIDQCRWRMTVFRIVDWGLVALNSGTCLLNFLQSNFRNKLMNGNVRIWRQRQLRSPPLSSPFFWCLTKPTSPLQGKLRDGHYLWLLATYPMMFGLSQASIVLNWLPCCPLS